MKHINTIFWLITCICLGSVLSCAKPAVDQDQKAIQAVLDMQSTAWSEGDLDRFMQGYWNDEGLSFFGSSGLKEGWEATQSRYQQTYPNREKMGQLTFEIEKLAPISSGAYYVMGHYQLDRSNDSLNGYFMIIFKLIDGEWKIIADTTC